MLDTKLTKTILRTTDNYIKSLQKAGIETIGDFLSLFPRDFEDRTNVLESFSYVNIKDKNTILVTLISIENQKTSNGKILTKAIVEDKNGFMSECVWFNRKFLQTQYQKFIQKQVILSGKVKYDFGKLSFVSPEIDGDLSKVGGEILPIYSDVNYIPGSWIGSKMENLKSYTKYFKETLPDEIISKYNFISKSDAINLLHFPKNKKDIEVAKFRLAYEELFDINFKSISKKHNIFKTTTGKSISIPFNPELVKEIISKLPFELTGGQKIALFQILKDSENNHAMQRLLEGDVGTGKTIVAAVGIIHNILQARKKYGSSLSPHPSTEKTSPHPSPLPEGEGIEEINPNTNLENTSPHPNPLPEGEGIEEINPNTNLENTSPHSSFENTSPHSSTEKTSPHPNPLPEGEGIIMYDKKKYSPSYIVELCKKLRKNQTSYEEILWEILRNRKLHNIKFRRQHPFGRYIADFYSEELKLVIELDGEIHKKQKEYDNIRDEIISKYGVKVLRLKNTQLDNISSVIDKITTFIPLPLGEVRGGQETQNLNNHEIRGGQETQNLNNHEIRGGQESENLNNHEVRGGQESDNLNNHEVRGGQESENLNNHEVRGGQESENLDNHEVRGGQETQNLKTSKNNSFQVAIMAPTEILARQHFEGLQSMFFEYGISSELLVGSTTAKNKNIIKQKLKSGDIDVIIGTHALIQEDVLFNNLFFVIIDEQHRFGVKQRQALENGLGNHSGIIPHNLNMTATPIPRTLALTLYGDQDLSIISEYPKDRKLIHTKVIGSDEARNQVELFIRTQLESGRQVFWISPLVEESEKMDLANAISTYESLVDIFSPYKVGLLHGKMKPKEKDQIMKEFSENKIQVLSSTSVVEVGVNVPNATIMCIEGAERFGLSQLHQFRGRVGRGKYQSYCYLFPTTGKATDRLKAMEKTNNGFELSEIDLELRGPGEVYGVKQSGVPEFKIADLKDLELISQIREDIEELLK